MKLLDFVLKVVGAGVLVDTGVTGVPGTRELVNQAVALGIDIVHLALLGQNLVTVHQTWVAEGASGPAPRVPIFDLVDHQATISSRREKPVVVITEAHAFNWGSMGLHFVDIIHGEAPNLNGSRTVHLARTRKECLAIRHHLQLRNIILGITVIGVVRRVPDLSIRARHNGSANLTWHIDTAFEMRVPRLEIVLLAARHFKPLLLQVVEGNLPLVAAICEARIILEPINVDNLSAMALALLIVRTIDSVEVEKPSLSSVTRSEHMTSITKLDLIAVLHLKAVVVKQRVGQYIHHVELVTNGCQDVETAWMECNGSSIFTWWRPP